MATPIQISRDVGIGRRAMVLLKHEISKSVLLQRTKKGRAFDLTLPPRIVSLRHDALDYKDEADQADQHVDILELQRNHLITQQRVIKCTKIQKREIFYEQVDWPQDSFTTTHISCTGMFFTLGIR